jgi:hypothetical protein
MRNGYLSTELQLVELGESATHGQEILMRPPFHDLPVLQD